MELLANHDDYAGQEFREISAKLEIKAAGGSQEVREAPADRISGGNKS